MTEIVFWDTGRGEDGDPLVMINDDAVPRPGDAIAWQLGADVPGGPSMHFGKVHSVSWILQISKRPSSYLRADVFLTEKDAASVIDDLLAASEAVVKWAIDYEPLLYDDVPQLSALCVAIAKAKEIGNV